MKLLSDGVCATSCVSPKQRTERLVKSTQTRLSPTATSMAVKSGGIEGRSPSGQNGTGRFQSTSNHSDVGDARSLSSFASRKQRACVVIATSDRHKAAVRRGVGDLTVCVVTEAADESAAAWT